MINFDIVDFSERRPEEVISFFWRSVYIPDMDVDVYIFSLPLQNNLCNYCLLQLQ